MGDQLGLIRESCGLNKNTWKIDEAQFSDPRNNNAKEWMVTGTKVIESPIIRTSMRLITTIVVTYDGSERSTTIQVVISIKEKESEVFPVNFEKKLYDSGTTTCHMYMNEQDIQTYVRLCVGEFKSIFTIAADKSTKI